MTDVLAIARTKLAAERERLRRGAEPRVRPPPDVTWNPARTRYENNVTAGDPTNIVLRKVWDLAPVDPQSFDPTQPPDLMPPPVCTTPPSIVLITGLAVGDQLAGVTGNWPGSPTLSRQWLRSGAPIPGETLPGYTLQTVDVGLMIGLRVRGATNGGAVTLDAEEVGPVVGAKGRATEPRGSAAAYLAAKRKRDAQRR
jgi:hypothetical protein